MSHILTEVSFAAAKKLRLFGAKLKLFTRLQQYTHRVSTEHTQRREDLLFELIVASEDKLVVDLEELDLAFVLSNKQQVAVFAELD